jgi:hypothetical protein
MKDDLRMRVAESMSSPENPVKEHTDVSVRTFVIAMGILLVVCGVVFCFQHHLL